MRMPVARIDASSFVWGAGLVVAAVLAASMAGLDNGFAYDDVLLIVKNERVHDLRWPWEYLAESYWGPMRGDSLYRPFTLMGFAVQWAVGGGTPLVFHAVSVTLYAAVALAVLVLARELLDPVAATLAALVFAVHPVHVEAVGNIVGQSELVAALAMVLAVALYVRDRRRGALRGRTVVAISSLFMLGLGVKEHVIVLPVLLVAAEVCLGRSHFATAADVAARGRMLLLALTAIVTAYLTLRFSVIGEVTGDVAHPALRAIGAGARAWIMLGLAPEFMRLFLWPAHLYADYSPQAVTLWPSPNPAHLLGAGALLLWVSTLVVGFRRSPTLAFAMLWVAVALALVSNLLFATGVLIAERTLFLPSVGVALALGPLFALAWREHSVGVAPRVAAAARIGLMALLVVAAVRSSVRQSAWEDNAAVISTMVADQPKNFRGHVLLGSTLAELGQPTEGIAALLRGTELYADFAPAQLELGRLLQMQHRCAEAIPRFRTGLALDPGHQLGAVSLGACLLTERRLHEARALAVDGLASGRAPGIYRIIKTTAESLLVTVDSVDSRNLFARAGLPFDRTGAPVQLPIRFVEWPGGKMPDLLPSDTPSAPK